jgi:hypothetical protein
MRVCGRVGWRPQKASTQEVNHMGDTKPAGEGVSDEEMVREVAGQTSSDLAAEDVFEREADGAASDTEIAKTEPEDLQS